MAGALALAAGILLRSAGLPVAAALLALAPAALLAGLRRPLLAAAVALVPAGWWRLAAVEAAPDAFGGRDGAAVTLEGRWDGRWLETAWGRLAVAAEPPLAPGAWRLGGRLYAVRSARNPGSFDAGAWLERRGVRHGLRVMTRQPLAGSTLLEAVRAHARGGATAGLRPEAAAFQLALALGDAGGLASLPEARPGLAWRDAFARSGLSHLLALSGQQVALLVVVLAWATARLGVRRYPLLLAFLAGYALVVAPGPSVTRAALMAGAALIALWLGRGRPEPLPALGLAALASLLAGPRWLFDLGFQLSYLSVLGLSVLAPPLAARLRGRPWPVRAVGSALAVTLSAQAFAMPLAASAFGVVPPLAPIANLLAEPLVWALVPLGFLAAALGPTLGVVPNLVAGPVAELALGVARLFSAGPVLGWGEVGAPGLLAYAAFAVGLALWAHGRLRAWRLLLVALAAVVATALPARRGPAEIVVLDVGQGDSTLVRTPGGSVLVDGGGTPRSGFDVGARVVAPALRALGVRSLRAVVATHADADHVQGLASLLRAVPVGALLVGHPPAAPSRAWDDLMRAARERGVPVQPVRRGQAWSLGGARLEVLGPRARPAPEDNANSVALAVAFGQRRALLLGDSPAGVEARLEPGRADLLLAPHHGSGGSSSAALLAAARPSVAVVSVGPNGYGLPDGAAVARLRASGARLYRTDRDGAVRFDLRTGSVRTTAR